MGKIRVGISGWSYDAWRGDFYPEDLGRGDEPEDASRITDRRPRRRKTRDVYVYFDNDARGRGPWDARSLAERLGVAPDTPKG